MQILLDTHLYLWWLKNDRALSKKARSKIMSAEAVYISSVSIWEAAIKIKLGKLNVDISDLIQAIDTEGFIELPITSQHAALITELPNYHRDPFDRMLIAQSITQPLRLLTVDRTLKAYSELVELI